MDKTTITLLSYSTLLIIGGLIGFMTAGSFASLLMSTLFAFLLLFSLYLKNIPMSYTVLSFLTAFFAYRTFTTGKFMPSGLMTLISLGVIGYLYFIRK